MEGRGIVFLRRVALVSLRNARIHHRRLVVPLWVAIVLGAMASVQIVAVSAGAGEPPPAGVLGHGSAVAGSAAGPASLQSGTFVFAAGGDFGVDNQADASLRALPGTGAAFFLALGDFNYGEIASEAAWCDFVTQRVGSSFAFQLVTGNHEEGSAASPAVDGYIGNYAACLPDRMNSRPLIPGHPGYPANYYVDYPPDNPSARIIMISANLRFDGFLYDFNLQERFNYDALAAAIDEAKQAGRWVIVGMHKVCLAAGTKPCEIGADLMNLLIQKRVDLVLQAHEHNYQRSKQLSQSGGCTLVAAGSYNAACVVDDGVDNTYTRGAGTVFVINGVVGRCCTFVNPNDAEAPYFTTLVGGDEAYTSGFVVYTVSPTQIDARVVASVGAWGDSFSLVGGTAAAASPTLTRTLITTARLPLTFNPVVDSSADSD